MAVVIKFIEFYTKEQPKQKLGYQCSLLIRLQNPKGTYLVPHSRKVVPLIADYCPISCGDCTAIATIPYSEMFSIGYVKFRKSM
jgi:hypothetical protein